MRRPFPHRLLSALTAALLMASGACTDRNPASAGGAPQPELPPSAVAMMTCTVSVPAGTLSCGGTPVAPGVSAAIIGGQGTYVRLASSGVSYDGTSTLRVNVTVENLTGQAMGTADGVTPSAEGVRVFFESGPTATAGGGPVEVANADGVGVFTAAAQKYFQYDGILAPGDTTGAKEWRFSMPPGVSAFTFGVYVATPVRAEAGWIGMAPLAPAVAVGDTQRVEAAVRNPAGGASSGAVAWTTSNPAIATVDAQGLVTGVAAGTATITATSGARTGSVQVLVYAPTSDATRPAAFLAFRVEGASLTAGLHADSVKFRLQHRGTGGFSPYLRVMLRHTSGIQRECVSHTGFGWVGDTPEMWCGFGMPDGILGGTWRVDRIEFSGRTIQHAALVAAGAPAYVYVSSSNEDRTAPTVDSLRMPLDTVPAGAHATWIAARSVDDLIGTEQMLAFIGSTGNPRLAVFGRPITEENRRRLFYFEFAVPSYYQGGTFVLDSLRVTDYNGNRRTLSRAALGAAGFVTTFQVSSSDPDTEPPTITAFSFSPRTVVGTGSDSVTVTLTATEPSTASGVWFMDMEFEKIGDVSQRRRCLVNGSTRVFTRTMTCRVAFTAAADAGTWYVRYIRAIDFQNNTRELDNTQIQQAGYPDRLVVTGPNPDTTAPRIAAFSFSPHTVAGNGADSVSVTLTATEPAGESGVWFMDMVFEKVSSTSVTRRCLVNGATVQHTRTMTCRQAFTAGDAGEWRVRYIRAIDFMNNTRLLRTAALQEAGYPTALTVTPP